LEENQGWEKHGKTWENMGKHGKTHIKTQYMEISIVMGDPLYRWMVHKSWKIQSING
jgi:hypothetical protein